MSTSCSGCLDTFSENIWNRYARLKYSIYKWWVTEEGRWRSQPRRRGNDQRGSCIFVAVVLVFETLKETHRVVYY
ncbi:hypothetical protein WN55_07528 [Dufourea novaeangliae]|uniref:Uncharacterized protein n=1 Tax=Dufourea novaeangliae TaxID=178035 RepID=A0A154PSP9_DUFNO|nr:hypothetical protein WN55_07528 [Dufourea novaeangliae]